VTVCTPASLLAPPTTSGLEAVYSFAGIALDSASTPDSSLTRIHQDPFAA
jgi:hypothetical protein